MLLAFLHPSAGEVGKPMSAPVTSAGTGLTFTLLPRNRFGAKCLDGSPPGYYFRPGSGAGKDSWHVFLPFGGWCTTPGECKWRATQIHYGSTKPALQATNPFNNALQGYRGILSTNKTDNPRFYNWNLVMPVYCDGGGFAGRAGFKNVSGSEGVYLLGWNIIKAVLTDVTDRRGLKTASQVLLSGVSAGAEAVVTLCDQLPALVPSAKTTKCLMDSGFFLDALDRKKKHTFKKTIIRMAALHDFIGNPRCARAQDATSKWKCFFPEHATKFIKSQVFIVNSLFDINALILGNQLPPMNRSYAHDCINEVMSVPDLKKEIEANTTSPQDLAAQNANKKCTSAESQAMIGFAQQLQQTTRSLKSAKFSSFIAYAPNHGTINYEAWNTFVSNGLSLRETVENWYFGS
ncbi:unnamed protein product [Closterium sp. NIES-53]